MEEWGGRRRGRCAFKGYSSEWAGPHPPGWVGPAHYLLWLLSDRSVCSGFLPSFCPIPALSQGGEEAEASALCPSPAPRSPALLSRGSTKLGELKAQWPLGREETQVGSLGFSSSGRSPMGKSKRVCFSLGPSTLCRPL